MNRRSFLAAFAAAAVGKTVTSAIPDRLIEAIGGSYDPSALLWTPVMPLLAPPPELDLNALLSTKRLADALMRKIEERLPRDYARQVILPHPGASFGLGDTVLAADLSPAAGIRYEGRGFSLVDAGPAVLDHLFGIDGGFSVPWWHQRADALALLEQITLDPMAAQLADEIQRRGINTFAPLFDISDHPDVDECCPGLSKDAHVALRVTRLYDKSSRSHEFRVDILGARV